MLEVSLTIVAVAALLAFGKWQHGFYLATIVAFLQDPARKIIDGQPPYFILFAGIIFAASFVGAMGAGVPLSPAWIVNWRRRLHAPFIMLILIVMAQAFHSFARYGHPLIPILGIISYLAPFAALALSHAFAAIGGISRIRSFLILYCVCAGAALTTVGIQAAGVDWPILGEVGVGLVIHNQGTILTSYSGTFRASEIAAWHATTCACVVVLLMTERKITTRNILVAILIAAALIGIGILTGRRKLLVMFALFAACYIGLLALFLHRARSIMIPAAVIGFLSYIVFASGVIQEAKQLEDRPTEYDLYLDRSRGVFGDVPERFVELGIAPITWAYNRYGLLGGGAGIGTQGVQHLIENSEDAGAAEGGLGKIMLELGLPGLLVVFALGVGFAKHIWSLLRSISLKSPRGTRLACGLTALLVANIASFSVAAQTYGDTFVLLFLGTALGALLALPRIVARQAAVVPGYLQERALQQILRGA